MNVAVTSTKIRVDRLQKEMQWLTRQRLKFLFLSLLHAPLHCYLAKCFQGQPESKDPKQEARSRSQHFTNNLQVSATTSRDENPGADMSA